MSAPGEGRREATVPCDRCKEPIRPEEAMDGMCSFCWNTADDLYDDEDDDMGWTCPDCGDPVPEGWIHGCD